MNTIKYKGTFDYHALYTLMKEYFESRGFDFYETRYKDKSNEAEFKWKAEREMDEAHVLTASINLHIWDYKKIESVVHGKRKTLISGRMELKIDADYKTDLSKLMPGESRFMKFLRLLYERIMFKEHDETWDTFSFMIVYELKEEIKKLLGIITA